VVYVAGAQYHRVISVGVTLGSRLPAHCTATGRVLLASQPESGWDALIAGLELTAVTPRTTTDSRAFRALLAKVRDQGWALVDQELEVGLLSIAIPLRHRSGEVAGAINVGIPTLRATPADMVATILPRLHDTAAQISAAQPG
jgi:IclR family pca regulon transcriptional regulator